MVFSANPLPVDDADVRINIQWGPNVGVVLVHLDVASVAVIPMRNHFCRVSSTCHSSWPRRESCRSGNGAFFVMRQASKAGVLEELIIEILANDNETAVARLFFLPSTF